MEFYMPTRLLIGAGCVQKSGSYFEKLGKRCLLVTGGSAAIRSGALADVMATLEERGIAYTVFNRITPNPALSDCQEGGCVATEFGADFIVGIGGGSPLDAAKAISVFTANPNLQEGEFYSAEWQKPPLPVVLIGTTAGTGSEVTSVSVLTDSTGKKHSIHDTRLYAALALGDARYTLSLPRSVTLSTGIDAVAHCVESAFSKKADKLSRLFSVQGVRLAFPVLTAAAENRELTLEQREELYEASIFGGLAINRTGTVFPHNVGYYLTERYRISHGFASASLMPGLLEHVGQCAPDLAQSFYNDAGITEAGLRKLLHQCLPPFNVAATDEEILTALPRWHNNGSVQNTIGTVDDELIFTVLRTLLITA